MSEKLLKKYEEEGAYPVKLSLDDIKKENVTPIMDNFLYEGDYFRHNTEKLAKVLTEIMKGY
jgi:hypothetical protein